MSNDKFNPLGVAVPGYTGTRLPGERAQSEAEFQNALTQPQPTPIGDSPRQGALVGSASAPQPAAPPTTIGAGYTTFAARNADDITSQYLSMFPQEA